MAGQQQQRRKYQFQDATSVARSRGAGTIPLNLAAIIFALSLLRSVISAATFSLRSTPALIPVGALSISFGSSWRRRSTRGRRRIPRTAFSACSVSMLTPSPSATFTSEAHSVARSTLRWRITCRVRRRFRNRRWRWEVGVASTRHRLLRAGPSRSWSMSWKRRVSSWNFELGSQLIFHSSGIQGRST